MRVEGRDVGRGEERKRKREIEGEGGKVKDIN